MAAFLLDHSNGQSLQNLDSQMSYEGRPMRQTSFFSVEVINKPNSIVTSMEENLTEHKEIAREFLRLIGQERFKEGLRFFAPDCRTHNPYIAGGLDTLTDAMIAANKEGRAKYPDAEFTILHSISDGDLVAVHTQLLNSRHDPGQGGLRQVHLFRFEGEKIVEYWDITQLVTPEMPNAGGAF